MLKYSAARLLRAIVTIVVVVSATFLLLRLMPESGYFEPGTYEKMPEQARIARLASLGIRDMQGNKISPFVQLYNYYKAIFTKGDFGLSLTIQRNTPVMDLVKMKAPYSIVLGLITTILTLILGWVVGLFAARFKDKIFDKAVILYGAFIAAIPTVILIFLLQVLISRNTGLSMLFKHKPGESGISGVMFKSWILPVFIMVIIDFAGTALWLRRYMVDEMNSDYVKLAYAKGLPSNKVFFGHVFRNGFTPMAYGLPSAFIFAIGGTLLIERAFGIPGMGDFFVRAVTKHDNNIVQAVTAIYVVLGVISVLLGDILAAAVDPRIRLDSGKRIKEKVSSNIEGGEAHV